MSYTHVICQSGNPREMGADKADALKENEKAGATPESHLSQGVRSHWGQREQTFPDRYAHTVDQYYDARLSSGSVEGHKINTITV